MPSALWFSVGVSQETSSFCYCMRPTKRRTADSLPLVVGLVPLVVGAAFLPPSGLAVILGCLRVAKHLGGVGRFALGAGGPLVRSGGALMRPAPTLDALVMLVLGLAGHRGSVPGGERLVIYWTELRWPELVSATPAATSRMPRARKARSQPSGPPRSSRT